MQSVLYPPLSQSRSLPTGQVKEREREREREEEEAMGASVVVFFFFLSFSWHRPQVPVPPLLSHQRTSLQSLHNSRSWLVEE